MPVNTRASLGNKLMNFYCALEQIDSATDRLVSENINGTAWKNVQMDFQRKRYSDGITKYFHTQQIIYDFSGRI